MSWADKMKASALAALAERAAAGGRMSASTTSGWNPHDVWLNRSRQPRGLAARPASRDPADTAYAGAATSDTRRD